MSGIIAREQALEQLSQKQSAAVLVISDSHGNPEIIRSVLSIYGQSCDAVCFCGDGIQDITSVVEYAWQNKTFESSVPAVISLCRGNNDWKSASYHTDTINSVKAPDEVVIDICGKKVCLTHGHHHNVYYGTDRLFYYAKENSFNVVLYGHTHMAHAQTKDNITVLNPGSCAQPRGGMPATFAIMHITSNKGIEYDYYEIKSFKKGQIQIARHIPASDDFNFLW